MNALRPRNPLSDLRRRSGITAVVLVVAALLAASIASPADAATHKQRTRVSMSVSATSVASGSEVNVSGTLDAGRAKVKGLRVAVQLKLSGSSKWRTAWTGKTSKAGKFAHAVTISTSSHVRIAFTGTRTLKSSKSRSKAVAAVQAMSLTSVTPSTVVAGDTVTITGSATPGLIGKTVSLESLVGYTVVSTAPIAADRTFTFKVVLPNEGRYEYHAVLGSLVTSWVEARATKPSREIRITSTSSANFTLGDPISISGVAGAGLVGKLVSLVSTTVVDGLPGQRTTLVTEVVPAGGAFTMTYTPTQLGALQYQFLAAQPTSTSDFVTFTAFNWFSLPDRYSFSATSTAEVAGAPFASANRVGGDVVVPADTNFSFALHGACRTFEASLGVDDSSDDGVEVSFETDLDGGAVADSAVKTTGEAAESISLDVSNAQSMTLRNDFDHPTLDEVVAFADWGNARLYCTAAPE